MLPAAAARFTRPRAGGRMRAWTPPARKPSSSRAGLPTAWSAAEAQPVIPTAIAPCLSRFCASFGAEKPRAIVSRNRYGAVVLNTDRMMFVDVDRKPASQAKGGLLSSLFGKSKSETPARDPMVDAMNAVTTRHQLAARVYETAAGYRLIVTSAPFEAGSATGRSAARRI